MFVGEAGTFAMYPPENQIIDAMAIVFIAGFVCRYGLHSNPQNADLFKAEYLLIILAVSVLTSTSLGNV